MTPQKAVVVTCRPLWEWLLALLVFLLIAAAVFAFQSCNRATDGTTDAPPPTPPVVNDAGLQVLSLTVVNPEASSQPQVGHPSAYGETHVSGTPVRVILDVPAGYEAIAGGFSIDDQTNGVYRAFGPGHFELIITDGFGLITTDAWAQAEWDFRIAQAVQFGWAHSHLDSGPLTLKK